MFDARRRVSSFLIVVVLAVAASTAHAQQSAVARPGGARRSSGLGVDLFGGAGVTWPSANDSFKAVKLPSKPIDVGGGGRLTGLPGGLFVQVAGTRWRDTGERVFVDSDGKTFPLGIPLHVNATYIDATVGVKRSISESGAPYFMYVGAGAGTVQYRESSPFAETGDDLKVSKASYHGLLGVEIPIVQRLAAVVEGKYRYIPGLLGAGGASDIFDEKSFGGFSAALGVRIGFGAGSSAPRRPASVAAAAPREPANVLSGIQPPREESSDGVILESAPVYIRAEATRTPLRTLQAGTRVRVLQQQGEWTQIEFQDTQWGPRIGWVQTRSVKRN